MNEVIKGENGRYYPRRDGEYFYRRLDLIMKETPFEFDVFWRINFGTQEEAQMYLKLVPEGIPRLKP